MVDTLFLHTQRVDIQGNSKPRDKSENLRILVAEVSHYPDKEVRI